jgi:hypothetical protein
MLSYDYFRLVDLAALPTNCLCARQRFLVWALASPFRDFVPMEDADIIDPDFDYGTKTFWDNKYSLNKSTTKAGFDWYLNYEQFKPSMYRHALIERDQNILVRWMRFTP